MGTRRVGAIVSVFDDLEIESEALLEVIVNRIRPACGRTSAIVGLAGVISSTSYSESMNI